MRTKNHDKDQPKSAHVIVIGNEKGGSGKSTVAMHVAIGLMRLGYKVGTIDLDSHQATLTNYFKNRWARIENTQESLPNPEHIHIDRSEGENSAERMTEETWRVGQVIKELSTRNDFIVIDTPGSDRFLSIVGHSFADTLITPMNDSFVDLDLLVKVDPKTLDLKAPSIYARMVWDMKCRRRAEGRDLDWVLMCNRLSSSPVKNKARVLDVLERLAPILRARVAPGFGDRVIFRELFLEGLTLLDLKEAGRSLKTMSNLTARQEVRRLIKMILPEKSVSTLSLLQTG